MFIRTLDGKWINSDHIKLIDIDIYEAASAVAVRAVVKGLPTPFFLHAFLLENCENSASKEELDKAQSWLDCYIHEIGLD
jgi:hypothetical protein